MYILWYFSFHVITVGNSIYLIFLLVYDSIMTDSILNLFVEVIRLSKYAIRGLIIRVDINVQWLINSDWYKSHASEKVIFVFNGTFPKYV